MEPILTTPTTLALTSYEAGQLLAPVLLLTGAVALFVVGHRNRRAGTGDATPDRRLRRRGRSQVAGGVLLLVLAGVGSNQVAAEFAGVNRAVFTPSTVLGLVRNAELSAQANAAAAAAAAAKDIEAVDGYTSTVAVYGSDGPLVTVVAVTGRFSRPEDELQDLRTSFEADGLVLGAGATVEPGVLGGAAYCWPGTVRGTAVFLCIFTDRGSLLAVVDTVATSLAEAARRALEAREAVIS